MTVRAASETQTGIVELATPAEATTGTDTVRAVTPAGLKTRMDALNLTGTYAARPSAGAVATGTLYFATNVPEVYRSSGTVWSVVGAGGNELAYGERTTMANTAVTTATAVTGIALTFVVGERPIMLKMSGGIANVSAAHLSTAAIQMDGTEKVRAQSIGIATDVWHSFHKEVRVTGLVPGSTHTAGITMRTASGGDIRLGGENATEPLYLQVVTL